VLVLLAAGLVVPAGVTAVAPALAVAGVLLGLPHGAVDHRVPGWATARPLPRRRLAALLAGYLLVVGAGAFALAAAPLPTLVLFLAVSAWHFGRGEVVEAAEAEGRAVPGIGDDLLPCLAHGLVVTVLPVAAWPHASLPLLAVLAPGIAQAPGWLPTALAVVTAGVVGLALAGLLRQGRLGATGELALLAATFWLVHPFAAFGVYFGLWHALRHTARLVDLAAADGPLRAGLRQFCWQAALPTLGALGFLGAVVATARYAPAPLAPGLLAAELATLVALTFPHAIVVTALDHRLRRRSP
jgi:Brp/Blh family beta-carotene 15,15'-monooxygenase